MLSQRGPRAEALGSTSVTAGTSASCGWGWPSRRSLGWSPGRIRACLCCLPLWVGHFHVPDLQAGVPLKPGTVL